MSVYIVRARGRLHMVAHTPRSAQEYVAGPFVDPNDAADTLSELYARRDRRLNAWTVVLFALAIAAVVAMPALLPRDVHRTNHPLEQSAPIEPNYTPNLSAEVMVHGHRPCGADCLD